VHGLERPVQIAYAVPDAEAAAHDWARRFGAGPFFLWRHIPLRDVMYRGRSAGFDHTSAYGQWGDVMVELVQDHGSSASVVRELYGPAESGLHHLAYFVGDLDETTASLAAEGLPLAMSAVAGGARFHFVDALASLGHFLELYTPSDRLRAFYTHVASAAQDWDGADPVRSIG